LRDGAWITLRVREKNPQGLWAYISSRKKQRDEEKRPENEKGQAAKQDESTKTEIMNG
jgi:hypothetical protein